VALLIGNPKFERIYERVARVWWLLPMQFLVISGLLLLRIGFYYWNSVGLTIDSICVALFLLWAARNPDSWVGRVLNSRIMTRIGVLSYSAYIWQTFFIHGDDPLWLHSFPQCLAFIGAAALFSYYCIEQPAIRLRKRIERRMKVNNTKITLPLSAAESE
jgi:peptidoglycan/LPS O-acetylase OafA/YrhL